MINKLFAAATILVLATVFVPYVHASGTLTSISDTLSRLKISTTANHTITFTTPTGIANGNTVTLTFPSSSFTMGASLTGVTIADNGGADNAVTSASYATNVLTITASASSVVTAGHTATIKIPSAQITNPGIAATYIITIGGTFGDTGSFAAVILSDDQIPVTASVDPTITMTVDNTTLALGTLSSSAIATTSENNIVVGTNGAHGYTIAVKDAGNGASPGLYSSGASKLVASATATLAAGTEGYGANCNKTSGSGSCSFADGSTNNVTGLTLAGGTFASYASTPSGNDTFRIRVKAAIASNTPAGSYADTLTVIGTANF